MDVNVEETARHGRNSVLAKEAILPAQRSFHGCGLRKGPPTSQQMIDIYRSNSFYGSSSGALENFLSPRRVSDSSNFILSLCIYMMLDLSLTKFYFKVIIFGLVRNGFRSEKAGGKLHVSVVVVSFGVVYIVSLSLGTERLFYACITHAALEFFTPVLK